jgi:hypothetical protein
MKAFGGVDVEIYVFLTSVLVGNERSASRTCPFTLGTHWIGDFVDPRACLDGIEKWKLLTLPGLDLQLLGRPGRKEVMTLYVYVVPETGVVSLYWVTGM